MKKVITPGFILWFNKNRNIRYTGKLVTSILIIGRNNDCYVALVSFTDNQRLIETILDSTLFGVMYYADTVCVAQ